MLPLPLAGEGWGEGRSLNEVTRVAFASAGPHPRPSPASGRGENTLSARRPRLDQTSARIESRFRQYPFASIPQPNT
ncbi:hypothetical protein CBM2589_B230112 [Cupriavidus taiwanensis]|uniref:Uncharacterized protein n=1 Tax=Cupriavidus taiwanensis TaxID=164546 RepID=A0A975X062_9BURK|nr:hypothetical protein CBM2589_B230112 [Cupriavidus taiwanensis]